MQVEQVLVYIAHTVRSENTRSFFYIRFQSYYIHNGIISNRLFIHKLRCMVFSLSLSLHSSFFSTKVSVQQQQQPQQLQEHKKTVKTIVAESQFHLKIGFHLYCPFVKVCNRFIEKLISYCIKNVSIVWLSARYK